MKVPPYSLEAEKSVLGSILINKDAILKISDFLTPEDFYHDTHAILYRAMMDLYDRRIPVDVVTLTSHLEDRNQLDKMGGVTFIAELSTEQFTAAHILQYAMIVKEKSTLRRLIKAGDEIMALGYDETVPLEELLEQSEKALFHVSQNFIKDRFVHVKDILAQTFEKISDLHDSDAKNKYRGIPTGFADLDLMLSGLQGTDLLILAGRPSMGKTSLALNMAQNIARQGKSVGLISLEMSKEQLVERMFCSLLGVDSWKMKTGKLSQEDFARMGTVMDEMNNMKIFIDDSSGTSMSEMRAKIRRLQMENGLDVLFIDYLQLMSMGSAHGFGVNRVQEVSEISRSLKFLAREMRIPIVALSQLSRAVESRPTKIPQLSDLRESGSLEQDADIVLMIYREDYYEEDTERKGVTDIFIRKHRNGPVGRIEMAFKKEQMTFVTLEKKRKFEGYVGAMEE